MKSYKFSLYLTALFLFGIVATTFAQYDDIYYNPDTDSDYYATSNSSNDDYDEYEEYDEYDDDYNDYYDNDRNSGYYYSTRIRRFNRPYRGFGYYDPCYVDAYAYDSYNSYYDPFFSRPSIYISFGNRYNPYNRYNRWNRWNRYNSFGYNNYNYYGGL